MHSLNLIMHSSCSDTIMYFWQAQLCLLPTLHNEHPASALHTCDAQVVCNIMCLCLQGISIGRGIDINIGIGISIG